MATAREPFFQLRGSASHREAYLWPGSTPSSFPSLFQGPTVFEMHLKLRNQIINFFFESTIIITMKIKLPESKQTKDLLPGEITEMQNDL